MADSDVLYRVRIIVALSYPDYIFFGSLATDNWPRTKGVLRKSRYTTAQAIDVSHVVTVQNMMMIGAGHPFRSLQLMQNCFSDPSIRYERFLGDESVSILRSWAPGSEYEEEYVASAKGLILKSLQEEAMSADHPCHGADQPWNALSPKLSSYPGVRPESHMPWETVTNSEFRGALMFSAVRGMLWAFHNHEAFTEALERQFALERQHKGMMEQYGPPGIAATYSTPTKLLEEIVMSVQMYEDHIGPLSEPSEALLSYAKRYRGLA